MTMVKKSEGQEPRDTTQPVLVLEGKDPKDMTYMELREAFKFRAFKQNEIIKLMAERLGGTLGDRFTKPQIKDKIVEDLGEFTNEAYVRRVLGPEYTDQRFNSQPSKKEKKANKEPSGPKASNEVKLMLSDELLDAIENDEEGTVAGESIQKRIIRILKEHYGLD